MPKQILLKNVRLSYAHLEKPTTFVQGQGFIEDNEAGIYSALLLIPKDSDAEKVLNDAIKEVKSEALASGIRGAQNKLTKLTAKDMTRYNDGIRDGDTKEDDVYLDNIYINAKAKLAYKPAVYDANNNRVANTTLYSGCYVNVFINVYNYAAASNIGCSFGLVALQFYADGEPLSGLVVDTDTIFGDKKEDIRKPNTVDENMF